MQAHSEAQRETDRITVLLRSWANGDGTAQDELIPLVYSELRRIARIHRKNLGGGETLRTTALVNEAWLRVVEIGHADWQDRKHFFAVAAKLMRRVLIDTYRGRLAAKRGGGLIDFINPDNVADPLSVRAVELLALDEAMNRLAEFDARRAYVVELRVFGGLGVDEVAEVLGVSPQTVMRDWRLAKAWLLREMGSAAQAGE